ncbi:efflux RND transporter periplasmic adaptor subunit [Acinetobacter sp. UBA1297]|uniref:efflux RND transporter periplasmic adaptor subunit n=1 Tax=Acinetobacter sp. UBA1297 TaxID=1945925 RepID=UPI00257FEE79|nr:efflux RND transporter periplasmic adaptor subunit [Acinetobacter sp. UBA1297]
MRVATRILTLPTLDLIPRISLLCLCLALIACDRSEPVATPTEATKIELIPQDLIPVKSGTLFNRTAFTGTIKAVNQSSIQAQITATATQVNASVGQSVHKGQVLVQLNNQDNAARLAQAQANLASTRAQAEQSRLMVERKRRLFNQGFISKVEYEEAQVDYRGQQENVRAQQANVDIAQKADRDGILRSPISGVITARQVEPGQTVSAGQTLFEIVDPSQLEIQASLPADQQQALKVGQKIEYQIQGNSAQLTATLSRISPIANQVSRQIEFFARPNEAIQSLSIGAFVEGYIISSDQLQGQLIPLDVIQSIDQSPYVWAIRNNRITKVPLTLLRQDFSNNTAVVKGLQNTDVVSRVQFSNDQVNQPVSISKPAS